MKVAFITYPSKVPWGSDFYIPAFKKLSRHSVIQAQPDEVYEIEDADVIHFHNIQLTKNIDMEKLHGKGFKVIAGIRGKRGLRQTRRIITKLDALTVNVDPTLRATTSKLHQKVYVLPPGIDEELFKPSNVLPQTFILGWVGRDHKRYKNADLMNKIGFSYRKATYRNYIPHEKLPVFYQGCGAIVVTSNHEGFCRPIAEATLCAIPVISSDVGVAREILPDNWIVKGNPRKKVDEYIEKLREIESNQFESREIALKNLQRALKYTWKKVVPLYDKAWEDVAL